jgi:rod shape-determining protein MreB
VVVRGKGLVLDEPAVVAIDRRSGDVIDFGRSALYAAEQRARPVDLVWPVSDGMIGDAARAQRLISRLVRPYAGNLFDRMRVLVTVPASITSMDRRVVRDVIKRAGASVVHLVEHTTAAALGGGLPVHEPVGTMVVDVGAELTEAAILSLGCRVVCASSRTGGSTIDNGIVDAMRRDYGMVVSQVTAEEMKLAVSGLSGSTRDVVLEARGQMAFDGEGVTALVERHEIQPMLDRHHQLASEVIRECLVQAPPELGQDLISRGVHLCGGGALLGGLADALATTFSLPFFVMDEPRHAVIRGASTCLEDMDSLRSLFVDE